VNAKRILEVGTLGGYSAIWMARALPEGGKLISLEAVATHAEVARKNIERAGLGAKVEVRLGRALATAFPARPLRLPFTATSRTTPVLRLGAEARVPAA
jgi:predicted O-methyltransferase YrrM